MVFAAPVWLYQLWSFITPGLYAKERRYAMWFVTAGTILFSTGVLDDETASDLSAPDPLISAEPISPQPQN